MGTGRRWSPAPLPDANGDLAPGPGLNAAMASPSWSRVYAAWMGTLSAPEPTSAARVASLAEVGVARTLAAVTLRAVSLLDAFRADGAHPLPDPPPPRQVMRAMHRLTPSRPGRPSTR